MPARLEIDLITLFPGMVRGFLEESILGRGVSAGLLAFRLHALRDWATDKHRHVDDRPFGGGAGMLLLPGPLTAAIDSVRRPDSVVILLSADGEPLTTELARELSAHPHLVLVSGHYEGVDQRVRDTAIDREISIGDYVLTNGTLAAAVLTDAICRHVPGVLGDEQSLAQDSFSDGLLGPPQYTRPAEFNGLPVPPVLLSGDHAAIEAWRQEQRLAKTRTRRPDLLLPNPLSSPPLSKTIRS